MADEYSVPQLARMAEQLLGSLRGAGVEQLPKPTRPASGLAPFVPDVLSLPATQASSAGASHESASDSSMPQTSLRGQGLLDESAPSDLPEVSTAPNLEVLRQEVAACTRCDELSRTRTKTVFGVGNPQARLCLLGEAPGADEDRQGEPFVGRAGQLLNRILEACRLRREEVYILNVLKCRPPGNRNPSAEEACKCRCFLNRQLELIDPEFICCLGAVAAQNLLDTTAPIGRLRGRVYQYRGIKVVCTYHPAYLLRTPAAKKNTWEDMKFLMRQMGTPVD